MNCDLSTSLILRFSKVSIISLRREYNAAKKDVEKLTEEDKLMRQFSCIERFATKLQIMAFMASFEETMKALKPQVSFFSTFWVPAFICFF